MTLKHNICGMALVMGLSAFWALGCASSSAPLVQPAETSHMKSAVGTADELSPLAPPEAKNIRKVGNQWTCEVNGKTMVYDKAAACWEPQKK